LFFERFIDITRKDLPDIDLDFPDERRGMVFDYMATKYGTQNVAHIGNIVKLAPKSALNKVGEALSIPDRAMGAVKVAMIERSIADERASKCLEDTFTTTAPGRAFLAQYPHALVAGIIEGHASHTSVHAAGLLVCNDQITNYAVVDANGIAHIEKHAAETLGLLKIDVLGLRTLTILQDAGVPLDWYNLPMDDPKAFEVFNKGQLCGIFQFEGNAMRSISDLITFNSLIEVDAVTALARPGPFAGGVTKKYIERMNGTPYEPIHALVESQMKETYGLPIYQEQTMGIVRDVGGFDWKDTSYIRKAVSKRLGEEYFGTFRAKFVAGATQRGMTEAQALATWQLIQTMGSWQMNKAHTRSYAVISMWCAYLKAHYPLEFAASSLRNAKDEHHAMMLLREMTKEGLHYVPFDIEHSLENWSIKDGKLLGGFLNLYGIGPNKSKRYVEARAAGTLTAAQRESIGKAKNPFADLFPLTKKYQAYYNDPDAHDIKNKLVFVEQLTEGLDHGERRVFIAELIHKNPRNANEENEKKKRLDRGENEIATGQLDYLDVRLQDDTGIIGGRIGRNDYLNIGVEFAESVPIGAHLLISCRFWNGIKYAFITKWKHLNKEAS
jgi:DNA polymerase III alpha subunit